MPRLQRTISAPVTVTGFGFWSGVDVQLEFRPAPADTGIVFVREDITPAVKITARVGQRIESPRRTTLAQDGQHVEMVEHVMAALAGLQIDNCEIATNAAEMPGVDGSSLPFVDALNSVDIVEQDVERACLIVTETTRVGNEESWIEASPAKPGVFSLQYRLDYGSEHPIGRETIRLKMTTDRFVGKLAPARTFIMQHEAQWLRQQGLAQRVNPGDVLVFADEGLVDNELRLENECAAHKMLDMVGDFALAGCDLYGHFAAHRSGHRLNAMMIQALLAEFPVTRDRVPV